MAAKKRAIDFTDVKDRSAVNPKRVPEGDYVMVIDSVEENESNAGNEQWVFILSIAGKKGGGTYPYYCQVDDNLWKIRNLIQATGIEVPKKRIAVDPNKLVGKEVGCRLEDDEYEGREKSVIGDIFPPEDVEPEEEPVAPKQTAAAKKPAASNSRRNRKAPVDPDEDVSDDDMEAMELDDL